MLARKYMEVHSQYKKLHWRESNGRDAQSVLYSLVKVGKMSDPKLVTYFMKLCKDELQYMPIKNTGLLVWSVIQCELNTKGYEEILNIPKFRKEVFKRAAQLIPRMESKTADII